MIHNPEIKLSLYKLFLFCCLLSAYSIGYANEDRQWVVGKWELIYDPDGAKTDWLVFRENGDAYSIWHDGTRVEGFYIVTDNSVKAVFTINDVDLITTFHFNQGKNQLRIVTSESGVESIYQKMKHGQKKE